jgi:hypothetical protein
MEHGQEIDGGRDMSEERHVPIEEWGKDHWSLLGYIECRCVDHQGVPDHSHMRTNAGRHPGLVGAECRGLPPWEPSYGTRLKGFWKDDKTTDLSRQIPDHDIFSLPFGFHSV